MRCEQVVDRLPAAAEGLEALDPAARRHVEHCLRCQADAVQYRKVLRAMRALRTEVLVPAPGLVPEILAFVSEAGERRPCAACSGAGVRPTSAGWRRPPRPPARVPSC